MGKIIDISSKIKREPTFLHFGEGLDFKVNDGKNTVFEIMELWENDDVTELNKMDKTIKLALGKEAFDKINKMDLSIDGYKTVAMAIMATVTGQNLEEFEKRFQGAEI